MSVCVCHVCACPSRMRMSLFPFTQLLCTRSLYMKKRAQSKNMRPQSNTHNHILECGVPGVCCKTLSGTCPYGYDGMSAVNVCAVMLCVTHVCRYDGMSALKEPSEVIVRGIAMHKVRAHRGSACAHLSQGQCLCLLMHTSVICMGASPCIR